MCVFSWVQIPGVVLGGVVCEVSAVIDRSDVMDRFGWMFHGGEMVHFPHR